MTTFTPPYDLGDWFDAQALARARRDRHGCDLYRAFFKVGSKTVKGYVFTYPGGRTWGYRRLSSGNVRQTYFALEPHEILSVESCIGS